VNKMARLDDESTTIHLHKDTKPIINKEVLRRNRHGTHTQFKAAQQWQHAAALALRSRSIVRYKSQVS
jgi:hypothetical protein